MRRKELFKLRKKELLKFRSISDLVKSVDKIIPSTSKIPLVVGYSNFEENQWKISYLKPDTKSDEITLINFLGGLKKLERISERNSNLVEYKKFDGALFFRGVNTLNYENYNTPIINIFFEIGFGKYNLKVYFKDFTNEGKYGVESKKEISLMEKIMDSHIGPCTHYERAHFT